MTIKNERTFSITPLKELIQRDLTAREFGFTFKYSDKPFMTRKKFFSSEQELIDYFNNERPYHAYLGPECNDQDFFNWRGHELVFDIDIDQYDDVRYCGCKGKDDMCPICWQFIQNAGWYIRDIIREDFGAKKHHFIFSGRRGIHLWFPEDNFFYLTREQRQAILDNIRIIRGKGLDAKIIRPAKRRSRLINLVLRQYNRRLYQYIFRPFLLHATRAQMKAVGLNDYRQRQIRKDIQSASWNRENNHLLNKLIIEQLNKLKWIQKNRIIVHYAPRIDEPCTTDINRLMRVPGSTHGATGQMVRFLSDNLSYPNRE